MPIFIFFAQGFEHAVVNMFVIPTGMMMGAKVTVADWWLWNQIPVTLGNLVGGFVFTGLALYLTHKPRAPRLRRCARRRRCRRNDADGIDLKLASRPEPATSSPNRSATWKASSPACRSPRRRKSVGVAARLPAPAATASAGADRARTRPRSRRRIACSRAGRKLSDQEKFKREQHPFDAYERLKAQAAHNEVSEAAGQFPLALLTACSMSRRTRTPTCAGCASRTASSSAAQFAGLADLAERYGGGYAHVTTRANLQIREIEPKNAVAMVEAIQDLGLCSRGSGADNIRNVTGTPTAGIDPQELIDTRPYARDWHFHILNDRSLYGLPRKFNVAFDGAGIIPVLEDTNDIGFQAVAGERRLRRSSRASGSACASAASPGTRISPATPA